MLPYAITMMIVAPLSARIVERIGSKITIALGLSLAATSLVLFTGIGVDTSYVDIAWRFVILALGMALVMAPATDSVMGSLPRAKAGVGSAVNDTTRQVGGALGVAIIGSVVSSVYGSKIADFFAGTPAPKAAVDAAKNSLGGAFGVASDPRAKQFAAALRDAANSAFVDAFHWGAIVGACVLALGALIVVLFLPARADEGLAPHPAAVPDDAAPESEAEGVRAEALT
jgi:MFS family permease